MSKNVKVNGVDYTGVSQVQLPLSAGGTALFKDVDEITDGGAGAWAGYQHTMQIAPFPYIIDQCEKTTAKGTFTVTSFSPGTVELFDTGLSSVHTLVIMLKTPVDIDSTNNGYPVWFVIIDVDRGTSWYLNYSRKTSSSLGGGGNAGDDGGFPVSNMTGVLFDGGKVNVIHQYNGEAYSAFRSTNEYLWFAW